MPHRTDLPTSGNPTFDEHAAWWLSRFKPTTQETYRLYADRWITWCLARELDPMAARRADVELFLRDATDRGLARSTVATHYDAVASIYKLAVEEDLLEQSPCRRVQRPRIHRELQRREVLTVLEFAAYLAAARRLGPCAHAIAVLGAMMGLRASEMASLTVESISTARGYRVLTFIGKGDKPARVPVPIPAMAAIDAVVGDRDAGPLLRTRTGRGMDRRDVYRTVVRTAHAAGITRPLSPHALRRTAGTVGITQGIPIREVQRLLRHARTETTLASYDLSGEQLERHASHQVAGFLAGWT